MCISINNNKRCKKPTFLKLFKNKIKRGVFKYEETIILVELTDGLYGKVVIGVDQGQIFDIENSHNVCALTIINWDTRKS